jgi:hypothetical protein
VPSTGTLNVIYGYLDSAIAAHNADQKAHGRIIKAFAWGDANPVAIATITGVVVTASIIVLNPFNSATQLEIGDAIVGDRLMASIQNISTESGEYQSNPGYRYTAATELLLKITLGTGNTTGNGLVILEVI